MQVKYHSKPPNETSFFKKALISYFYFIQGIFLVMPSSFTLTYSKLPQYGMLSLFAAASLPFSFKYIIAPIVEKYNWFQYGRRKIWVVLTLLIASILTKVLTLFTTENYQVEAVCIMTVIILMMATQDVCVDAMAIKQLQKPQLASFLQSFFQHTGVFVGSLIFIELVSQEAHLASFFGLEAPFMTVSSYLNCVFLGTFIPVFLIHYYYKEKITPQEIEAQENEKNHSLFSIIKRYRFFLNPRYRLCRQVIFFIFYPHGLLYFMSGFDVELINRFGFKKQLLTTLSNISIVPVLLCTYILSTIFERYTKNHPAENAILTKIISCKQIGWKILIIRLIFIVLILIFFDAVGSSILISSICILLMSILASCQFFMDSIVVNTHACKSAYAAMFTTFLASTSNFGRNTSISLKIIGVVGFQGACWFGCLWILVWIFIWKKVYEWICSGLSDQQIQVKEN